MKKGLDRARRVLRKRIRIALRFAPYLSGKSASRILVDEIYLGTLGAPGDPAARSKSSRDLAEGRVRVLDIIHQLRTSAPTQTPNSHVPESLVLEVYTGILGRSPSQDELQRSATQLAAGVRLATVIQQVMSSADARATMFSRALDDGGVAELILADIQHRRIVRS